MIKIKFVKIPAYFNPPTKNEILYYLHQINITPEDNEDPVHAWVKSIHDDNNIPYIDGLIDIRILQEMESNPDVMRFFEFIGGEFEDGN